MTMTPQEWRVLDYIEQCYLLVSRMPDFADVTNNTGYTAVGKLIKRADFIEAAADRGIDLTPVDQLTLALSSEQLAAVNVLLDQNDRRSDSKKLSDLGVTTQKYQGWLKDPKFSAYLSQRVNVLFPNGVNEAHRALLDNVKRGDLGAIKLLYEMTGTWSSKPAAEMNIEFILMKVLEAIQKHVSDPAAIEAIAQELGAISVGVKPTPAIGLPEIEGTRVDAFRL